MENLKKYLVIGILGLSISIVFSGVFIGYSIQSRGQAKNESSNSIIYSDREVLSLSQVAKYLNMSEDEVKGIINTEKNKLEQSGSFSGEMFPYIKVNSKYYFYKDAINVWLAESVNEQREYDTVNGYILK